MKIELWNKLIDISKTKKNGVYSKDGWHYFVKDNNVLLVGNRFDGIFRAFGVFLTQVWHRDYTKDSYDNHKNYNEIIKKLRKEEGI